jgi:perosamine synthetase
MKLIPLTSPDIRESDIEKVSEVLRTGMLVQGVNVLELEKSISSLLGIKHTKALSNGTATMHLALLSLGIGKGDEVIVPAFSYIATANVVELVGATPVFVDIDIASFNIDVNKIEEKITTKTKAIIPVHEFGLACDIETIMQIANKHNLFVIEDAACALGATQNNKFVGSFGKFGSFSLHPRKAITCGEGGLLTTNEDYLNNKISILRNHGVEIIDGVMEFVEAGYNYRMTDFQAALMNAQLVRLMSIISYKQKLSEGYFNYISSPKILLPSTFFDRPHTWQTFHVLVDDSVNRDNLILQLKENGIGTNYGAQCIPAQRYYSNKYDLNSEVDFPNALRAYKKGLALPIYEKLSLEDIHYISETINKIL